MNNQSGKPKQKIPQELKEFKLMSSAALAISVVIMQAFIGTGITDSYTLKSVIGFSIAIPLLSLFLLIISFRKAYSVAATVILALVLIVGGIAFIFGIGTAFLHLSPTAGDVFGITVIICVLLYFLLERLYLKDSDKS